MKMPKQLPTIDLCGVEFQRVTESQCVAHIMGASAAGEGGWVVTPNVDILRRCTRESAARRVVEAASMVVADGMPLIWASRLQGTPLPERVSGSHLIWSVSAACADTGRSLFLLGGDSGTADAAATVLKSRHPQLNICGTHFPPFGFMERESQIHAIIQAIQDAEPDIVLVALPFPLGELLIERLRVQFPQTWFVGVGVSFSFVCGAVRRAPQWMQRSGLEWMHRLVQQPRRLAKRYLVHGIPFALSLLVTSLASRRRYRIQRA